MINESPCVYVKYHDLRRDIKVECYFDCSDDMINYFSAYNPSIIHIIGIDAYYHEDDKDVQDMEN